MSGTPAPSPAYVATLTAFDCHHPAMRQVRLSARQIQALGGLTVPVTIDGTSRRTPCKQAELAIQDATRDLLGREVCAVLWRDRDAGDLFVLCGGSFVQVATIDVAPAQTAARAA
jgi:hypothetical protein